MKRNDGRENDAPDKSTGPRRGLRFGLAFVWLVSVVWLGTAANASAHGPTIEVGDGKLTPPLLNLYVGTTVHFLNTLAVPGGRVVVDASGVVESPRLKKPGDGWHFTFEKLGTYDLSIAEDPTAKARIVILPKRKNPVRPIPGR